MVRETQKITALLVLISAVQFLAGMILLVCLERDALLGEDISVAMGCALLVTASSLVSIGGVYAAGRYQNKNIEDSMRNLEGFNEKLREQKHDLMNHFQVVYGLLELGEYEEAHAYIRPVFKDIQRLNMALKTAQPAVNALLQAKMEAAAAAGIDFYLEVETSLKEIPVKPWDLCRILANLLDNAMTALEGAAGEKKIQVRMRDAEGGYRIGIGNNGPAIPKTQLDKIFNAGFSTKREEGHGQGLAIVARLVREACGEVTVESSGEETLFTVFLPKGTHL